MAADPFTLYTNQIIDNTVINDNGVFTVLTGDSKTNLQANNSIMLNVKYHDFSPDPLGIANPDYSIRTIIESPDTNNNWYQIGAQFEPTRNINQGHTNIIIVQPNIFNIDEGVPVDDWNGQNVTTRISRQQGSLGTNFRIRIELLENKYNTADAFSSIKVDIYGAKYNV